MPLRLRERRCPHDMSPLAAEQTHDLLSSNVMDFSQPCKKLTSPGVVGN
jgi:hypothetical protein